MKHLPTLAVLAVAAGIFAVAPAAHADSFYGPLEVQVWTGSSVTHYADMTHMPGSTPTFTFDYTGPLDFVNNTMSANPFGDFFGSYSSDISGLNTSLSTFLNSVMSTSGYGITTYMSFTGTYTGGGPVSVAHDDGASLYYGSANTTLFSSPWPTTQIINDGTNTIYSLPTGTDTPFDLIYVEANGAPSVLSVTGLSPVPEPGTIGLMALGMIGLGALMYRGSAFNS